MVRVIAHRGGPGLPGNAGIENTLAAFSRAAAAGFGIETDVRASADGVPVLHHDPGLVRTAGEDRAIGDLPWRELRGVLVGGREPLARLDDLLDALRADGEIAVNVDVKDRGAIRATVAALRRTASPARLTVASFSALRAARARHSLGRTVTWSATPVEIACLVAAVRLGAPPARATRLVRGVGCLQIPVSLATGRDGPALTRLAHALGIEVHVWTVDEPELARTLVAGGVDALISDRPDVVAAALSPRVCRATRP